MNLDNFHLQYGVTGESAIGQVTDEGSYYKLQGTKTAYRVPKSASDLFSKGYVNVQENTSRYDIITIAGPGTVNSAGVYSQPTTGILLQQAILDGGRQLVARYIDNIDGTDRTRIHVYEVFDNYVKITVESEDQSTDYLNNYNGFYGGAFDTQFADRSVLEIPGTISNPTLAVDYQGSKLFMSHFMDPCQSHASDIDIGDPATISFDYFLTYSTLNRYNQNTDGNLQAPLKEVLYCTASTDLKDCLIVPNDKSNNIEQLVQKPWIFLASKDEWINFSGHIEKLIDYGFDDAIVMPMWWWAEDNYAGVQQNGHDWYPGGDNTGQEAFGSFISGNSWTFMPYTYWGVEVEGTDYYTSGNRVLNSAGIPTNTVYDSSQHNSKEDKIYQDYMVPQVPQMVTGHHITSIFYDVGTFAHPGTGQGMSIDMDRDADTCSTMSGVIKTRRSWMYSGAQLIPGNPYAYGEGGRQSHENDMHYLWAGAIDGMHSWQNTNGKVSELSTELEQTRSVSNFPMYLESKWIGENQFFSHIPDFPARFFTLYELDLQTGGSQTLYPYSDAMQDRLRCYSFAYGRPGQLYYDSQGLESFQHIKEQIKEFYLVNHFTRLSRVDTPPVITYIYSDENIEYTAEELLYRIGVAGLRNCRARLRFSDAHEVYVNRSSVDWTKPGPLGSDITIPPDGYVSVKMVDNKMQVAGSAISTISPNSRIDFAYKPNRFLLIDGRNSVDSVLGKDIPGARFRVDNYTGNYTLTLQSDGTIAKT